MAVGFPTKVNYATGDVLSATNMNDLSGTVNLLQGTQYSAGKNVLINSDFSVNQRSSGTITTSTQYPVDRFSLTFTGGSCSATQNTFTPGTNPSGLTVKNYLTMVTASQSATTDFCRLRGAFEDVYTFAGETVTFSFYAKAASGTPKVVLMVTQNFGTGGSTSVDTRLGEATLSTSWARYSITATMPSISGKTIGAGNFNTIQFFVSAGSGVSAGAINLGIQNNTFDLAAFQLEAGSTASAFQTATGTKQGELAACQRYYNRYTPGTSAYGLMSSSGYAFSTTLMRATFALPVEMRVVPTAVEYSTLRYLDSANATGTISAANLLSSENSPKVAFVEFTSTGMTANRPTFIQTNNSTSGFVGFTAEL